MNSPVRTGGWQNRKPLMMEKSPAAPMARGAADESAEGRLLYGSRLTIAEARKGGAHNNATSLQVPRRCSPRCWALEHPNEGIVEPEEWSSRASSISPAPICEMVGVHGDWTPLDGRRGCFPRSRPRGPVAIQNNSRP